MAINAHSSAKWPGKKLSNFPRTPFVLDDVECESVEGLVQALKIENPDMQAEVCKLYGIKAKRRGAKANKRVRRTRKVYWKGREIEFRSPEHMKPIKRGLRAKFTQNKGARRALLATRGCTIVHRTGFKESDFTSLPARDFVRMLYEIRAELEVEEARK